MDISSEDLDEEKKIERFKDEENKIERFKKYKTIKGSWKFQVIVFEPHKKMRISTRPWTCEDCQQHYGSCEMFKKSMTWMFSI